jgi:type I restriction enzyme S subunit
MTSERAAQPASDAQRVPSLVPWLRGAELPADWPVRKIKHLAALKAGEGITSEAISAEGRYPVFGGNGLRGYTWDFTHEGTSVLIGRQGALCGNVHLVDGQFWASEHAIVATPARLVDPRWLAYLLAVMNLGQYSVATAQPGIAAGVVGNLGAHAPAYEQQGRIADFLDRETAKIDALISKQEQLIERAQERRRALVDTVVWAGLGQAELAATGIDPAPLAPAHWVRAKNRHLLRERNDLSTMGAEEMLSVSHITGVTPRSDKNVTMFEAETTVGYRLVSRGDLVINTMWAWMGALGVSKHAGIVSPAYGVYAFHQKVDVRYFEYLYRSRPYVAEMTRHSRGIWSSRLRLYPASFVRLGIVVPPIAEQAQIADHLDGKLAQLDKLIEKTQRFIHLSKERRAALIAAAVTGQIEIRGDAA